MSEFEKFKADINLIEYAASEGYYTDRRESSRNCVTLRHDNGDKINIIRNTNRHWIYFSFRDEADNGTIIDFVQRRKGLSFGNLRQELRPWIGKPENAPWKPPAATPAPDLQPLSRDREKVHRAFSRMRPVTSHRYLEQERAIPPEVLRSPRFAGKVYTDGRGNVVFPHYDQDGLSGYEIKNHRFTGFAPGGEKGLWTSAARRGDTRLVVTEAAIDALSFHALNPQEESRYISIGGKPNPQQPGLLRAAIDRMPEGAEIVIATDADPDGRNLADMIRQAAADTGRADLAVIRAEPPIEDEDWNDQLVAKRRAEGFQPLSAMPTGPKVLANRKRKKFV